MTFQDLLMTTPTQQLKASPLQIERHEFLDIEVHSAPEAESHSSLSLTVDRNFARHDDDPSRWKMVLTIRFGGEQDGKPAVCSGMLRIAGYFRVHEKYPEAKAGQLIEVTGASILYGACREMLANLTARGPHGMVSLPSISFVTPKPEVQESSPKIAETTSSNEVKRAKVRESSKA